MNTENLKDQYRRFKESLTDEEYDLFCYIVTDHYKMHYLPNEVTK